MSDDLIERLESAVKFSEKRVRALESRVKEVLEQAIREKSEAAARIRELESANYRLTEERDRLKSWADRDSDELEKLRARLATAEADALERAARVLTRAAEEIRSLKPKADE